MNGNKSLWIKSKNIHAQEFLLICMLVHREQVPVVVVDQNFRGINKYAEFLHIGRN